MAAENIGELVPTKIPGLVDQADIQAAFRLYHYGSYTFDINETDPAELINPSIAYTINDFEDRLTQIESGTGNINASIFTAKGSLISSSSSATSIELVAGSNGRVLTTNSATSSGLEWAIPSVSLSNVSGLGSDVSTFLATPSSANLASAITDETGSGSLVFGNSPTITSPTISTPALTLSTTTSSISARVAWDSTNSAIAVGDGTNVKLISPDDVSATLENKTIDLSVNTLTGTISEFNSALSDAVFATQSDLEDLRAEIIMVYGV